MFTRARSKDLHARGLCDSDCGTGVGIDIGASVIHCVGRVLLFMCRDYCTLLLHKKNQKVDFVCRPSAGAPDSSRVFSGAPG